MHHVPLIYDFAAFAAGPERALDQAGGLGEPITEPPILVEETPIAILDGTPNDDAIAGANQREEIYGAAGHDTLFGAGQDDLLAGGQGRDALGGGRGHDTLLGNAGADRLSGNRGDDLLKGGRGADWLRGGQGDDTLKGGHGADTFVWRGEGSDVILDFVLGEDIFSFTPRPGLASTDEHWSIYATQVGDDVVLTYAGETLTFLNADLEAMGAFG